METCTVSELKKRLEAAEGLMLLDVRQLEEFAYCNLAHEAETIHIPLHELPGRYQELAKDKQLVVYCHHGIRSAQAIGFLQQQGYEKLENLKGGIHAWSEEVDSTVPVY